LIWRAVVTHVSACRLVPRWAMTATTVAVTFA